MDKPKQSPRELYQNTIVENPALFDNSPGEAIRIVTDLSEILAAERTQRARLSKQGLPEEWSTVGVVFEDQYIKILRDAVEFPDGNQGTYIRILPRGRGPAGVAVLPLLGKFLVLIRHFRHATRTWHLEIPRGFMDDNETEEQAADRELFEELGVKALTFTRLGCMHSDTGLLSEYALLFAAKINETGKLAQSEGIDSLRLVSADEFGAMTENGEITDSFTLAAVLMAQQRGLLPCFGSKPSEITRRKFRSEK